MNTEFVGTIEEFIEELNSADPQERIEAAWAFSEMGTAARPALHALILSLQDPDGKVVAYVCDSLRHINDRSDEVIFALRALVSSTKDRGIKTEAENALLSLEHPELYAKKIRGNRYVAILTVISIFTLILFVLLIVYQVYRYLNK